jgi:isocitrate/isopropylmalate dehydrogenase
MMASYLGYADLEMVIRNAVQQSIENNITTQDMGGEHSTEEVIKSVEYNITK